MFNIAFGKLNNDRLYTLALRIKEVLDKYPSEELGIMLYVKNFVDEFIKYQEAIQRMKEGLKIIGEKDGVRDNYSIAFRTHVKNYIKHPDEKISKMAKKLLAEIDKNGKQFYSKSNKDETAILEYIFKVSDEHFIDFIKSINADVWYNLLKAAQKDFEDTVHAVTDGKAEEGEIESATNLRPDLVQAIRNLLTFLPLHFNITQNEQLGKLIAQLKEEIKLF